MVAIEVGRPKMPQEHFRVLQSAILQGDVRLGGNVPPEKTAIYRMITDILAQLEVHRPHGVDGKHGDLHTTTCGCFDIEVRLPDRGKYNFESSVGPRAFDIAVARMNELAWDGRKWHELSDAEIVAEVRRLMNVE